MIKSIRLATKSNPTVNVKVDYPGEFCRTVVTWQATTKNKQMSISVSYNW